MKKITIIAVVATIFALVVPPSIQAEDLAEKLQNLSVTVHSPDGQGSGVIITRDGINYVLTAGHMVSESRKVISYHDNSTGGTKKYSKFPVLTIVKEIVRDGRSIGYTSIQADVVVYSSPEAGDDLCLLRLRDHITDGSVEFWSDGDKLTPPSGTRLVHVGSFLGQDGSNSFSEGSISQIGRVMFDKVFDQGNFPAFPGSSGGGVFLQENGKDVGVLLRGAAPGFVFYCPVRRIHTWAHEHNIDFIFDKNGKPNGKIILETLEPESDDAVSEDEHSFKDAYDAFNKKFPFMLFHP